MINRRGYKLAPSQRRLPVQKRGFGQVYVPREPDARNRELLRLARQRGVNVDRKLDQIQRREDDESYP